MTQELLVIIVLPALLAAAAAWDLASFTIPNILQFVLIGAFAIFAVSAGMPPDALGGHLLAGTIGLVIGFTLFAFGYVGGGDAKLFACVLLWLGLHDLLAYTLVASVAGGALTLVLLSLRRLPLPATLFSHSWAVRLHDQHSGVPYGVALALGAFLILPQTEIFRLAAGG
jgi:prepilin peptidase CpaA